MHDFQRIYLQIFIYLFLNNKPNKFFMSTTDIDYNISQTGAWRICKSAMRLFVKYSIYILTYLQ